MDMQRRPLVTSRATEVMVRPALLSPESHRETAGRGGHCVFSVS
jgi:hypothetical protein